jgi:putative PIN family toxin of toxin-antitoxin system
MSALRLVLDTNVVISALVFQSAGLAPLRRYWKKEVIKPLICRETAKELITALAYPKFDLSPDEQQVLLGDYLPFCEAIKVNAIDHPESPAKVAPRTSICRDPADEKFLILALAGRADRIVTGDKDLLILNGAEGLSIIKPQELLASLT